MVFFIDHGDPGFFDGMNYEYFVERMMDIPANHITLFNECCYSGSLIELIEISETINEIFDISQTDIFKNLQTIANNQSIEINEKIQKIYNEYHIPDSPTTKEKITQMVKLLYHYSEPFNISPKLFIEFNNKSTIICSCSSTKQCPTLPIREIIRPDQYAKNVKIACAQGGVFSSIILESLFYPKPENDFSFDHFTDNLMAEFKNIEREFKDILIKQNTIEEQFGSGLYPKKEWELLKTMYKQHPMIMEDYFNTDFKSPKISISSRDSIPNIRSITLSQELWHIDDTNVDPLEYITKVYYYIGNKSNQKEVKQEEGNQDPNQYVFGHVDGVFNDFKFILDFYRIFESFRKEQGIEQEFDIALSTNDIKEETENTFQCFNYYIRDIFDQNTIIPLFYLLPLLKINYQENFQAIGRAYFELCRKSLKETVQYWKTVKFYRIMFL